MSKLFSFQKLTISLFCTLLLSFTSFGQSGDLQNDLTESFKKFKTVRLNNQTTLQKAKAGTSLTIPTAEKNYQLTLIPSDLRAPQFFAEDTSTKGVQTLPKNDVTTFKGVIVGEKKSEVRLTIDGAKIEGYFFAGDDKFFIEPAKNYSLMANEKDYVVYRPEDSLKSNGFSCNSELVEKIERGKNFVVSNSLENVQSLRVLKLATDADFEYVNELGGAVQANSEILSVLNMVEGLYKNELNLSIKVVFQHTWSVQDSFIGTNVTTLLSSFKTYWNTNYPFADYPRDAAHLFSAKPNVLSQGYATVGAVCVSPVAAYGISGRIDWEPGKFLVTAHELGHNIGANHVDATQSCDKTLMNASLGGDTPLRFCSYSLAEVNSFTNLNGICLTAKNSARLDFDGDSKADISVFRPSNGVWYITNSGSSSFNFVQFGQNGDKMVPADYDGDGKTDLAIYRNGIWYELKSSTNTFDVVYFGASTDIPAPADFDGDGKADVAVFRPAEGVWHRLLSSRGNSYSPVPFGAAGDVPVPADFDGDGKADVNVFRPSNGSWYRLNSTGGFAGVQFGQAGDKPLIGDFDGDGKSDVAVYRPSNGGWYILKSSTGGFSATTFGLSTDIPAPADFDGDGKADISVFRPSDGVWYRFNSSNNSFAATQFGGATDTPIPAYYGQ